MLSKRKKRILWVTFDFPPRQSSATFRPIKIYKYLNKNKFTVDFLTTSLMFKFKQAVQDNTLMEEIFPRPSVYRLPNVVFDHLVRTTINSIRKKNRSVESKPKKGKTKIPDPFRNGGTSHNRGQKEGQISWTPGIRLL